MSRRSIRESRLRVSVLTTTTLFSSLQNLYLTLILTYSRSESPTAEFSATAKDEKRLRRKIDLYIVPLVALLYLFCFIDRANIGENSTYEHSALC